MGHGPSFAGSPVREMGAGWPSTLNLNGTICVWESSPTDALDGTTEAGGPRAGSCLELGFGVPGLGVLNVTGERDFVGPGPAGLAVTGSN